MALLNKKEYFLHFNPKSFQTGPLKLDAAFAPVIGLSADSEIGSPARLSMFL